MDKHTPGPWFVEPLEGKYYGSVVRIGDGKVKVWQPLETNYTASDREIAKGWDTERGFDHVETQESYKTAILLAAAPELLEALEGLLSALDRQMTDPDRLFRSKTAARAVAAKAKGGAP